MSASTAKPAQETLPVIPPFSYAQAAKGRTSTTTYDASHRNSTSDVAGSGPKRAVSSDYGATSESQDKNSMKRTASEGRVPENTERIDKVESKPESAPENASGATPEMNGEPLEAPKDDESRRPATLPSSPEYGTTSISTLPKEEDAFSAINASSDSTWEKHSQSSQNGTKAVEKNDAVDQLETDITSTWDEDLPAGPALKEAPPPTMNIWQQRREAQAAKVKVQQPPAQKHTQQKPSSEQELPNGIVKVADGYTEPRKQEPRKKGKFVPAEDKNQNEGVRGSTKDRKSRPGNDDKPSITVMAPPPPPGDAFSWPTPESAITEEKKKPQMQSKPDEGEKEKEAAHKPKASGKKAWTQMEFVPSAVFETHVPQSRRGGRGPSGGRDNAPRGRNNAVVPPRGGDKPGNTSTPSTPQTAADDSKANAGSGNSLSNTSKPKRASSAGPISSKELRKLGDPSGLEKGKGSVKEDVRVNQPRKASATELRKLAAVPIPATPQINIPSGRPSHTENLNSAPPTHESIHDGEGKPQPSLTEAPSQPKVSENKRRSEGSIRPHEIPKESQGNGPIREREERSGRGRGGRGRGGANHSTYNGATTNGNTYTNGQGYPYQTPVSTPSRSFSNHERIPSQPQGAYYGASPHRSHRSGSKSHYNSGYVPAGGRFSHGPNTGPPHLPNIQTDLANMSFYPQGPQGIMSAVPYNPYEEQVSVWNLVQMQMEYYFSVDNLCKDMFLRKHMDSQGYVFLSVIANFNRIVALTTDVEIIRYVCLSSQKIEFKPGQVWQDGLDRLRAREGWSNFVLPVEHRDPSAQHDGPMPTSNQAQGQSTRGHDDRQTISPRTMAANDPMDFPYQSLNGIGPSNAQGSPPGSMSNGDYPLVNQPPLSAAVSEFSPAAHSHGARRFASPDSRPQEFKPFTDEEVQKLHIMVRQPINSPLPPFPSASSRTFSNGSIDGRNINDELSKFSERQSRPANGEVFESDRSARSRSPYVVGSPSGRPDFGRSPPVFWMKKKDGVSALDTSPKKLAFEPYVDFRRDALREREQAPHGKQLLNMQNLYDFWSHFLIRNFNGPMYEEFRRLANEDKVTLGLNDGMQSLMQYYDEALLRDRAILDDDIARHFVELVNNEDPTQDRPAFRKLRNAWRNGAFNLMNRHRILKLVDNNLRVELDR